MVTIKFLSSISVKKIGKGGSFISERRKEFEVLGAMANGLANNRKFEQAGDLQEKYSTLEECIKDRKKNLNIFEKSKKDT